MNKLRILALGLVSLILVFSSCSSEDEAEAPVASFSASSTDIDVGQTITFTDKSAGDPTSWEWIFVGGEPETSTKQNPEVTYKQAGTYPVSLTVTNAEGANTKTRADYITVTSAEPVADFTVSPTFVNVGDQITIVNKSLGEIDMIKWTVINPHGQESVHYNVDTLVWTCISIGFYDIKLEVTNEFGSDEMIKEDVVESYAPGLTINNTTPSRIKVYNETSYNSEIVEVGSSVTLIDENADGEIRYKVETFAPYGLDLSSDWETYYTSEGDKTINFEINRDYFFLTLENNTISAWNKEVMNAGLTSEVTENAYINWVSQVQDMGYYNLWSNTEIRCHFENSNQYVYWRDINWPSGDNVTLALSYNGKKDGQGTHTTKTMEIGEADQTIILK